MTTETEIAEAFTHTEILVDEEVVHVFPTPDGWRVKPQTGKVSVHGRKALAALFAKQIAANAPKNGRVIFWRADGSVEAERTFECMLPGVRG